jgi:hypothetical protein
MARLAFGSGGWPRPPESAERRGVSRLGPVSRTKKSRPAMTPFPQDGGSLATLWRDAGSARGALSRFPPLPRGVFGATTILSPVWPARISRNVGQDRAADATDCVSFGRCPRNAVVLVVPASAPRPFCEENPRSPGGAAALTRKLSRARRLIHARAGKCSVLRKVSVLTARPGPGRPRADRRTPPGTATLHFSHAYRTGLPLDQGTPRPLTEWHCSHARFSCP